MANLSGTNNVADDPIEIDSWEAAFAALEPKGQEDDENTADSDRPDAEAADSDTTANGGEQEVSDNDASGDDDVSQGNTGGLDPALGDDDQEGGNAFSNVSGESEEEVERYIKQVEKDIDERVINDIAKEFLKRPNVRSNNGVLGSSIDDPDICKYDEDNVPHFYNPHTGQEFMGENPRRQALEWIEDDNKDLARRFNMACAEYKKHLMKDMEPAIAVKRFAPKYEKLDPIRKGMFDNVILDYEVKDGDGKVIGYSCDLDKALNLVDRQVAMIQKYAKDNKSQHTGQSDNAGNGGPALDMKTSSGAIPSGEDKPVSSLAEAMEMLQDKQLAELNRR